MIDRGLSSRSRDPALAGVFAAAFLFAWTVFYLYSNGNTPPVAPEEPSTDAKTIALRQQLQHRLSKRTCPSPAAGPDPYTGLNEYCIKYSPTAIFYKQHFSATTGYPPDWEMHMEAGAAYDGLAVKWGVGAHAASAADCAAACWSFRPPADMTGLLAGLPCNAWAYCPNATCFEVDAHKHSQGDCWLKWTEAPAAPEVNMRGTFDAPFRLRHPNAPAAVPWVSGVILPPGVELTEGTPSPRWSW